MFATLEDVAEKRWLALTQSEGSRPAVTVSQASAATVALNSLPVNVHFSVENNLHTTMVFHRSVHMVSPTSGGLALLRFRVMLFRAFSFQFE